MGNARGRRVVCVPAVVGLTTQVCGDRMSRKVANKVVRGVTIVALIVLLTNGFAAVEGVSPAYAVGYQASGVAEAYAPIYAYAQAEADDTDFGNPCILRNLGNFTAGPVTCSPRSPPKIPVSSAT